MANWADCDIRIAARNGLQGDGEGDGFTVDRLPKGVIQVPVVLGEKIDMMDEIHHHS